jgi:cation-transporting ATPase 13A3/4/5
MWMAFIKRLAFSDFLQVQVLRQGSYFLADSADLVPGDIVIIDTGILPADMVLIRGECIVDENMLTGGYKQ